MERFLRAARLLVSPEDLQCSWPINRGQRHQDSFFKAVLTRFFFFFYLEGILIFEGVLRPEGDPVVLEKKTYSVADHFVCN